MHIFLSGIQWAWNAVQKRETLHGLLINDVCHITLPSCCLYEGLTDRWQGEINDPYSGKPVHGSFAAILMIKKMKSMGRAQFIPTANE